MPDQPEEIEVEIVEIDDASPTARSPAKPADIQGEPRHRSWQRTIRRHYDISNLWWPVALLLGIVALALILTVGVAIGAIYLTFIIIRGIFRRIAG